MTKRALQGLLGAAAMLLTAGALAQPFPSKPVTLIVPVAPGGILDTVARMIAPERWRRA